MDRWGRVLRLGAQPGLCGLETWRVNLIVCGTLLPLPCLRNSWCSKSKKLPCPYCPLICPLSCPSFMLMAVILYAFRHTYVHIKTRDFCVAFLHQRLRCVCACTCPRPLTQHCHNFPCAHASVSRRWARCALSNCSSHRRAFVSPSIFFASFSFGLR